jgi:hypothetical protein
MFPAEADETPANITPCPWFGDTNSNDIRLPHSAYRIHVKRHFFGPTRWMFAELSPEAPIVTVPALLVKVPEAVTKVRLTV